MAQTFTKPGWFEIAQEEYWACKERVCVMDMSSFAKFELEVSRENVRYMVVFFVC
jgi:pyruvate dehydrogenase phosphatase regulatory subunit